MMKKKTQCALNIKRRKFWGNIQEDLILEHLIEYISSFAANDDVTINDVYIHVHVPSKTYRVYLCI